MKAAFVPLKMTVYWARIQLDDGSTAGLELHVSVESLQMMCLGERKQGIYATKGEDYEWWRT